MKVLVVTNMAPFVWGGAEELAMHLRDNLILQGHESEVLRIPFQWEPAERIPSQMLLARWLELDNVDHVIALKFPAYLVRHERKTLWVLHQYRQAYDLFDAGITNMPCSAAGDELRAGIKAADDEAFAESRRIFVNSSTTRDRMQRYNGIVPEVLLPPVNDPHLFVGGKVGDYVFLGGRVNGMKRQHLVLEAVARAAPNVRVVIGGPPDSAEDERRVRAVVDRLGIGDRVTFDLGLLPRERYAAHVNGARAVCYVPFDEDSLGYVAMEAATARRPLITTSDSGGVLGLVRPGETGWVAEPDADALADALSAACADPARATALGEGAADLWRSLDINWPSTVEALIS